MQISPTHIQPKRQPQQHIHQISTIEAHDVGYMITTTDGVFLTMEKNDLSRPPKEGDEIIIQLPIVVGFASDEGTPQLEAVLETGKKAA